MPTIDGGGDGGPPPHLPPGRGSANRRGGASPGKASKMASAQGRRTQEPGRWMAGASKTGHGFFGTITGSPKGAEVWLCVLPSLRGTLPPGTGGDEGGSVGIFELAPRGVTLQKKTRSILVVDRKKNGGLMKMSPSGPTPPF